SHVCRTWSHRKYRIGRCRDSFGAETACASRRPVGRKGPFMAREGGRDRRCFAGRCASIDESPSRRARTLPLGPSELWSHSLACSATSTHGSGGRSSEIQRDFACHLVVVRRRTDSGGHWSYSCCSIR